jgi:L-ascorbate metabolism protein UlaG (beta-lactamase superfamily)
MSTRSKVATMSVAALSLAVLTPNSLGAAMCDSPVARVEASPNFVDGAFVNLPGQHVEVGDGASVFDFFFADNNRVPDVPPPVTPVARADLDKQGTERLRVTWMGHSSMLIEVDGHLVLTDPVWSERVSPVQWAGPARFPPTPIPLEDLPELDGVLISHDHYDHLDHKSIEVLNARGEHFFVPLGVGAHLRSWGVPEDRITELDWWQQVRLGGLDLVATPTQHFSGRGLKRNPTLWASWAILGAHHRVWFSGDTGPWDGFDQIGERLGPFDLSLIEIGAMDPSWANIHLGPDAAVRVHQQVGAKVMQPIHWGTFNLALHAWDQPVVRLQEAAAEHGVALSVPLVGQVVDPSAPVVHDFWQQRRQLAAKTPGLGLAIEGA